MVILELPEGQFDPYSAQLLRVSPGSFPLRVWRALTLTLEAGKGEGEMQSQECAMLLRGTESKCRRAELGEKVCPLHCHPPQSCEALAAWGNPASAPWSFCAAFHQPKTKPPANTPLVCSKGPKRPGGESELLPGCCGKMERSPYENCATLPH